MSAPLLLLLFVLADALATRRPRDYPASLDERTARQVEALVNEGKLDEAVALGRGHVKALGPSVDVLYEWGVALNAQGELRAAQARYDEVLAIDPEHAAARYDRAELHLSAGRLDEAAADLAVALKQRPDHWAVHFRLAEVAGLRADPHAFEVALLDALRHGFDLRALPEYPRWRVFLADPQVGPVLERVVMVYGDERVLDQMRAP